MLRAARRGDVGALRRFHAGLSVRSRAQRFHAPLRELPREMLDAIGSDGPAQRFIVAEDVESAGDLVALGQYAVDPDQERCELAIVVADAWQGRGLGARLFAALLHDATAAGLREARVETQRDNLAMQALARGAGFALQRHPEDARLLLGWRALTSSDERVQGTFGSVRPGSRRQTGAGSVARR